MENSNIAYIAAPFGGWVGAQLLKIVLHRKLGFNLKDATQSGGMPSSHAAFMGALSTSIGIGEGFSSVAFAICLAISSIVVYDATDVRLTTGQQTEVLKKLAKQSGSNLKVEHDSKGHTIPEVAIGILVGIAIGVLSVTIL